jgi:replicative DNA helicase
MTSFTAPPHLVSQVKVPPHSIEAEQSVLGGLLLDNQSWDKVVELVGQNDFYLQQHQTVFAAISDILNTDQPLDVLTLTERLRQTQRLDMAGGDVYLFELVRNTPSAANIVAYATIVRERSVLRQLIHVGGEIAEEAFHPDVRCCWITLNVKCLPSLK